MCYNMLYYHVRYGIFPSLHNDVMIETRLLSPPSVKINIKYVFEMRKWLYILKKLNSNISTRIRINTYLQ